MRSKVDRAFQLRMCTFLLNNSGSVQLDTQFDFLSLPGYICSVRRIGEETFDRCLFLSKIDYYYVRRIFSNSYFTNISPT